MKYLLTCLSILAFFTSCENEKYEYGKEVKIELTKDPCFGFCPVYTFQVDGNGNATFDGKRNVEKEGEWSKLFSIEETNQLFDAFANSQFWDFKDEYTAQVTDLPTIWVSFTHNGQSKKIKDYYGAPAELKELEKMVEIMAEAEEGWVKKGEIPNE